MKEMEFNKKGLSEIVATVLIILIAIAAVILVWLFLVPSIKNSSEKVSVDQASLSTSVLIEKVLYYNSTEKQINFSIKRTAGDNEITGFMVVLEDVNGNGKTYRENMTLSLLQSRIIGINYVDTNLGDLKSITVNPVFIINNGKEAVGNVKTTINVGGGGGGSSSNNVNNGEDQNPGDENRTIEPGNNSIGNESNTLDSCFDSDALVNGTLVLPYRQSSTFGLVVYLINNCKSTINEDCLYTVSAADVCLNSTYLAEQTCKNENGSYVDEGITHEVVPITCGSCSQGVCS